MMPISLASSKRSSVKATGSSRRLKVATWPSLSEAACDRGRGKPHYSSAAYDAYVRGRHALDKRGESELDAAVRFFRDSIDADPTHAPAYAGMADGYGQLGYGS